MASKTVTLPKQDNIVAGRIILLWLGRIIALAGRSLKQIY